MKYRFFSMLLSGALTCAVLSGAAVAEPQVVRFAHVAAENTPKGKGALLFQKLVSERMGDRLKVEVYPDSTLYSDKNQFEALINNDVQFLAPSLSKFGPYTQQLTVFDLPFLFNDDAAVQRFWKRTTARKLLGAVSHKGLYGLAFWANGMKQMTATKPLNTPEMVKGLAFRVQASGILADQYNMTGGEGVPMSFSDSYAALKSNKVQGTENTWSNILVQNYHTVQPYITESNHGVLAYMLITNRTFWSSLPFDVRGELQEIIDEVTVYVNDHAREENDAARKKVLASGKTKLIELSPAEKDSWRKALKPLYQQYGSQIDVDVIKAAQGVNR